MLVCGVFVCAPCACARMCVSCVRVGASADGRAGAYVRARVCVCVSFSVSVSVCVCARSTQGPTFRAGGQRPSSKRWPAKLCLIADTWSDLVYPHMIDAVCFAPVEETRGKPARLEHSRLLET